MIQRYMVQWEKHHILCLQFVQLREILSEIVNETASTDTTVPELFRSFVVQGVSQSVQYFEHTHMTLHTARPRKVSTVLLRFKANILHFTTTFMRFSLPLHGHNLQLIRGRVRLVYAGCCTHPCTSASMSVVGRPSGL